MATVTTQERTNILKLVAGMFNAAPGAAYLNEFTNAFVDLNKDLGALANALGQTGAFQSLYPSFLTADEFANKFLDTLGLKANTEAQDWVKAKVNAGESFASVAFQALVAIDASTADDFKAARDQLTNKATAAEYYSVTLQASSDDLAALQNVVAKVTDDSKSVEAANDANQGGSGKTFTLTNSVGEQVNGTAGNDTFKAVLDTAAVSTLNVGDVIDGKAGNDTLDLIVESGTALPAGVQVSNVENVVITNKALTAVDAAAFSGVQKVALKNNATAVTVSNLAGLTLGVEGVAANKVTGDFGAAATAAALDLNDAKGNVDLVGAAVKTVNIGGNSQVVAGVAQTVTVGGSAAAAATALNVNATAALALDVSAAAAAVKVTVTGAGAANLGTLHAVAKTVDASANTGGVTVTGAAGLQEVTGGAGKDSVTLAADLADKGFVKTGAGDDKVILGTSAVNKGATIELGAGNDSIVGTGVIDKDAIIDGGEGNDTLALELVGATNIGAFKNFEIFDVAAMSAKTLDLDILASKNTVTAISGSAALNGAVELTNLGAGVDFVATKNMGTTNALTLTQKAAGALTVTLDADSKSATAENDATTKVVASNATSLKAVFDNNSAFVQTATDKNDAAINLTGTKATTLEVVSGGSNATNTLTYVVGAAATTKDGLLTSVTVTGSQALNLDLDVSGLTGGSSNLNKLATVDASALTGSLTFDLADLANAGTLKLGSGADVVKVAAGAAPITAADIESVVGFSKAATKDAADVAKADVLDFTTTLTVGAGTATANASAAVKGVVSFLGTGPTTLDAAIGFVDALSLAANSAVVFNYLGDSYAFIEAGANDQVVKLVGVTGITELAVNASGDAYIL